jgi:hypothetical protein
MEEPRAAPRALVGGRWQIQIRPALTGVQRSKAWIDDKGQTVVVMNRRCAMEMGSRWAPDPQRAYLWQYSRPGGTVVFDFRLGRGRDGPKRFLGGFEGILQTDGYSAYDQIGGPGMVHAACWAHARRQFFEAVQLNPRDPTAL